ncbi:MAG: hypothetical protein OXM61_18535, partial [Candidatus Poribacteria bacterium]|nr:hypothetical protein [Candidatus Poribacteria bacterium]
EMIDKTLGSLKKETARKYFFSGLENPLWLKPLAERDCFKYPPKTQRFDDGTLIYPYWYEIQYLKNVCKDVPDEVVNLLINLPETDNSVVYDGILDIALQLPIEYSVKLKDKILEYAGMEHQFRTYRYANLLGCWIEENQTSDALELLKILITFAPDPQSENKQRRRNEDPMDMYTLLEPKPRMLPGEYRDIMLKGILPFTESDPYKVACILIDTTANMISLRRHKQDLDKQDDISESWCPRLQGTIENSETPEETLVQTLTFACEQVFEKKHKKIGSLDNILRKQRWKIFKRLRHHLYAQNPNQQTKPWILELILNPEYYNQWKHSYEFRLMIQHACKRFGDTFLTKKERTRIFETILAGPSKANYQEWLMRWLGQEYTEEGFLEYKRLRHRIQLAPFASVLFGKYKTRLQKLETEVTHRIFDEDYIPSKVEVREIPVSKRSPYSHQDLAKLTDDNLLNFINAWDDEDKFYENEDYVEINIEALANVFQTLFKESIIPDPVRFKFWMKNRERIARPIYIRVMIYVIQALVKERNFDQLNEWLTFSEWILSHPNREHNQDYKQGDESRENQNWTNSRRAVGDFIGVCLEKDIDAPITARRQIAKILRKLCTQSDWHLDEGNPNRLYHNDPLTEGINNTRSSALEDLVKFGFWLRKHEPQCEVHEVTTLLEKRFSSETGYFLTPPEYAILGKNYLSIYSLDETWAIEHKSDFFPKKKLREWVAAFSSFVLCNGASKPIFKILQDDFKFALRHLDEIKNRDRGGHEPIDTLGDRLFTYYLWEMYPLNGEESLIERFYQRTDEKREHWANLFSNIGHRLSSTGKDLDQSMKDRVKKFFKWRLKQEEPTELRYFTYWLQAECLEAKWRLKSYSKVIDVCKAEDCEVEDWEIYLKELCQMLPKYTAEVVECFFKLTSDIRNKNIYIQTEEAKTILKTGLNSTDMIVYENAKHALNNLLRADKMEYMDLVIKKDKQTLEK